MPNDRYSTHTQALDAPATHGFAITPNDATDLSEITRAIYVGSSGALAVTFVSGAELVLPNVPAGSLLPLRLQRVRATGTTATDIVGLS
ncbi:MULTISPECIES: spike base protein, RCAP_Rcc01079 family [Devosia]|uniref:spike base protein, RCAP_Rcc01079 family n=1 Tax=Devosia TaxID=46913 RepID=UPI000CE943D7|nr:MULTISPECIES: hypothetical protein [Devosia]AVF05061.1 hypothetical protein C4375_16020 [Devosia sp. I507]